MSIKVMTMVWDGFPAAGSELLAMLALADWCDDRGGCLYPSIKAVAEKIRVGEKHARNIMHKFESDGFLAVVGNLHGGKPGTTRQYRLNVPKLKELADAKNADREASGKASDNEWADAFVTPPLEVTPPPQVTPHLEVTPHLGVTEGSPGEEGRAPLERSLSTIEPSVEPPNKTTLAAKPVDVSDEVWADFKRLRTAKRSPLTGTALLGIRREAFKACVTLEQALSECCARGWQAFKADWVAPRTTAPARETGYAQSMREKYEVAAPRVAAVSPLTRVSPNTFFDTLQSKEMSNAISIRA